MVSFRENIKNSLDTSLKNRDEISTATLRLILAAIKDHDIQFRTKKKGELISDEEILNLLQNMIKQRKESKALITLVSDKKMLKKLTDCIPDIDITSEPTTVIYQNIKGLSYNLLAEDGTAAIRIIQDNFCNQLIKKFGKAIISTSANISGTMSPKQFSDINDDIINNVDYIVNLRKKERRENSSRIIKIEKNGSIIKLR